MYAYIPPPWAPCTHAFLPNLSFRKAWDIGIGGMPVDRSSLAHVYAELSPWNKMERIQANSKLRYVLNTFEYTLLWFVLLRSSLQLHCKQQCVQRSQSFPCKISRSTHTLTTSLNVLFCTMFLEAGVQEQCKTNQFFGHVRIRKHCKTQCVCVCAQISGAPALLQ